MALGGILMHLYHSLADAFLAHALHVVSNNTHLKRLHCRIQLYIFSTNAYHANVIFEFLFVSSLSFYRGNMLRGVSLRETLTLCS